MEVNLSFTLVSIQYITNLQKLIFKKHGNIISTNITNINDVLVSGTIKCHWPDTKTGKGNMTEFLLLTTPIKAQVV